MVKIIISISQFGFSNLSFNMIPRSYTWIFTLKSYTQYFYWHYNSNFLWWKNVTEFFWIQYWDQHSTHTNSLTSCLLDRRKKLEKKLETTSKVNIAIKPRIYFKTIALKDISLSHTHIYLTWNCVAMTLCFYLWLYWSPSQTWKPISFLQTEESRCDII